MVNTNKSMIKKETLIKTAFIIFTLGILFSSVAGVSAKSPFEYLAEKISSGSISFDKNIVAQIIFFFIVWIVTYSVINQIPSFENRFIGPMLSFAISLLGVLFVPLPAIVAIALSYSAYTLAITAIIVPTLITMVARKFYIAGHIFLSKLLWGLYLVGLTFIIGLYDWENAFSDVTLKPLVMWIILFYGLAYLFAFIMLIAEGWFYRTVMLKAYKSQLEAGETRSRMTSMAKAEARLRTLEDEISRISPAKDRSAYRALKQEIEDLRKYISEASKK